MKRLLLKAALGVAALIGSHASAALASCVASGNHLVCSGGRSLSTYGTPGHKTQTYRTPSGSATFYNYRYQGGTGVYHRYYTPPAAPRVNGHPNFPRRGH